MSSVLAPLRAELERRVLFAESHIAAGLPAQETWRMQGHAYMTTLRSMRGLTMDEATDLTRQIADGPWPQELRASMVAALGDAVSAPTNHVRSASPQQHMRAPELFYTRSDWATFEDQSVAADPKMRTMAKRLARLGISCPSEILLKRSVAILVAVLRLPRRKHCASMTQGCHRMTCRMAPG
jgi:hypothetical protein